MRKELIPIFSNLPEDNFGVHVEDEMDVQRLLWLVNQIGETKLRKSAAKRNKYYPDRKLFVSVILKRFQLKVPPNVYAEVKVPIYWVYLLVLHDHSAIKVGMTGRWPNRAYDFVKTANYTKNFDEALVVLFDTEMSVAFCASSKSVAAEIEDETKKAFAHRRGPSPYERGLINYGCGGHTEWFDHSAYAEIIEHVAPIGLRTSLRANLTWKDQMQGLDTISGPACSGETPLTSPCAAT